MHPTGSLSHSEMSCWNGFWFGAICAIVNLSSSSCVLFLWVGMSVSILLVLVRNGNNRLFGVQPQGTCMNIYSWRAECFFRFFQ